MFLREKGIKLVCPGQCVIQCYMRYVRFKPQTIRNVKCSYHFSGPGIVVIYPIVSSSCQLLDINT